MTTKTLRESFSDFLFGRNKLPIITENSSMREIAMHYPTIFCFLERKYGVNIEAGEKALTLQEFVHLHGLPPAQIVFMEVQMEVRSHRVKEINAIQAKELCEKQSNLRILDVREDWEIKICKLAGSETLTTQLLDKILSETLKHSPLLLYCHFGIRSLDAAVFFTDRGFTEVYVLKGGIDAWSQAVDPTITRYENNWC